MIIKDALDLAPADMGEGTGPAVKTGILAASAILSGETINLIQH